MTQHKTFCATWALEKTMPDESELLIEFSPEQRQELRDSLDRSLAEALRLQQEQICKQRPCSSRQSREGE